MTANEVLLNHEALIKGGVFLGIFVAMALWEFIAPRRALAASRGTRWLNNLGILILNSLLVRAVFPAAAVGVAVLANEQGSGLLHLAGFSEVVKIVLAIVALDLVIYFQHILFHAVPLLWRLHRVHHADLDFDVTTGTRFHPIEILLSMLVKAAAILFIGAPALAVFLFEIILNASSMFNHSNIRIPTWADRVVRWMLVTPDMHRVHHSIEASECNSNFGFSLPWWDRLFGTYRAQPAAGHERMIIGIMQFRSRRDLRVDQMLLQPLREQTGGYPINRQPGAR